MVVAVEGWWRNSDSDRKVVVLVLMATIMLLAMLLHKGIHVRHTRDSGGKTCECEVNVGL